MCLISITSTSLLFDQIDVDLERFAPVLVVTSHDVSGDGVGFLHELGTAHRVVDERAADLDVTELRYVSTYDENAVQKDHLTS